MLPPASNHDARAIYNAIQIYPWSEGALYQVYAAPGQITNIALEPGESLTGAGPIAAGDTARWIIGDTESGAGPSRRVHILVKPTRTDITTNLVITTDRRMYMLELRAGTTPYMPAVAWAHPAPPASQRTKVPATPIIPARTARNYRYGITGDTPPWRPVGVYDDGRRVYVEFPRGSRRARCRRSSFSDPTAKRRSSIAASTITS